MQRPAQPLHGAVQTTLEIDKDIAWPELPSQFFPGHNLALTPEQHGQDLKRLVGQTDFEAMASKNACQEIDIVRFETKVCGRSCIRELGWSKLVNYPRMRIGGGCHRSAQVNKLSTDHSCEPVQLYRTLCCRSRRLLTHRQTRKPCLNK